MTIRELVEQAYRNEIRKQLEAANAGEDEISSVLRGFDESATFHLDQCVGDDSLSIEETISNYLIDERDAYIQLKLSRLEEDAECVRERQRMARFLDSRLDD